MREPRFWWRQAGAAAALLSPLGAAYGAIAAWRMARPGQRAGIPVLCVGNLTLGGAGKTPTAIAVGKLLAAADKRPFFLSRGYGGKLAGPVLVDPAVHRADDVGDEPLLLVRIAPTIVARDRVAGAAAACAGGADVIIMDDGFQNPSLVKDCAILVVDARRGVGNGRVFPAGPLRAPLAAQLARADALVVIGNDSSAVPLIASAKQRRIPVFDTTLESDADDIAAIGRRPVLAFAGIGDPDKFFATLAAAGIEARIKRPFPDHHRYSAADAASLLAEAAQLGLLPVTTEKDMVRIADRAETADLAAAARVLAVTLGFADAAGFRDFVLRRAGPSKRTAQA